MLRVLIVEDYDAIQKSYVAILKGYDLVQALTWDEGLRLFNENANNLDAIVLDGDLKDDKKRKGWLLAEEIRKAGYTGPMIAASCDAPANADMCDSGCDHSVEKSGLVDYLKQHFPPA